MDPKHSVVKAALYYSFEDIILNLNRLKSWYYEENQKCGNKAVWILLSKSIILMVTFMWIDLLFYTIVQWKSKCKLHYTITFKTVRMSCLKYNF